MPKAYNEGDADRRFLAGEGSEVPGPRFGLCSRWRVSLERKERLSRRRGMRALGACGVLLGVAASFAQNPWADRVVSYSAGDNPDPGYTDSLAVLGEPSRMTGEDSWVGAVTPFNTPWLTHQVASVGANGHLTVAFDEPITDDAGHRFGIDLIIFGNGFFGDAAWPAGVVGGVFEDGPFTVSVSADGVDFVPLASDLHDAMFPTLGYLDLAGPYDPEPGAVPSDFTRPVDPRLTYAEFDGRSFEDLVAMYDGSGGGIPLDINSTGLGEVYYVRIDVPAGATSPEFDAFVSVPEPATVLLPVGVAVVGALRRRKR